MDRQVTPPKQLTSPTWGPTPPCKQALNPNVNVSLQCLYIICRYKGLFEECKLQ